MNNYSAITAITMNSPKKIISYGWTIFHKPYKLPVRPFVGRDRSLPRIAAFGSLADLLPKGQHAPENPHFIRAIPGEHIRNDAKAGGGLQWNLVGA